VIRPEIHARFLEVLARGLDRAEREHAAHLAKLKGGRTSEHGSTAGPVSAVSRRRKRVQLAAARDVGEELR
jgi:hypothetical protein